MYTSKPFTLLSEKLCRLFSKFYKMYDAVTSSSGEYLVATCQIVRNEKYIAPSLAVISFDRTLKLVGEISLRGLESS